MGMIMVIVVTEARKTDIRTYLDRSMIVFLSRRCAEMEELRRI